MTEKKDRYLTKTDFVHYLQCPRSLWLLKHKPEVYPYKEFSDFLKKIAREGYEVERYAQMLFPDGVSLPSVGTASITKTKEAITQQVKALFQATVQTEDGLFARADILTRNDDGSYNLYEVKSANKVKLGRKYEHLKNTGVKKGKFKRDTKQDHVKDACFQKIAFEKSDITIDKVFIIHTNGDYVRETALDVQSLLEKTDITDFIKEIYDETKVEMNNALKLLQEKAIEESACPCLRKTKSNHCDAFEYFNGTLPEQSIWEIGNLREKKLCTLLDYDIQKIEDITEDIAEDIKLSDQQRRQVQSVLQKRPIIDEAKIQTMLGELAFPLFFFDYEAASSAVPKIIGTRPWQQIPFQFSLHILTADGTLTHKEYLNEKLSSGDSVMQALCEMVDATGTIVSWHASYEKTRNKEMAKMHPQYASQLQNINDRMFDLKDIIKEAYTDAAFHGSASIKDVLPILCPHLSYKNLNVQDGTQAMERWFVMAEEQDSAEKEVIKNDLLEYCKLDTLAMVELYKVIRDMVAESR